MSGVSYPSHHDAHDLSAQQLAKRNGATTSSSYSPQQQATAGAFARSEYAVRHQQQPQQQWGYSEQSPYLRLAARGSQGYGIATSDTDRLGRNTTVGTTLPMSSATIGDNALLGTDLDSMANQTSTSAAAAADYVPAYTPGPRAQIAQQYISQVRGDGKDANSVSRDRLSYQRPHPEQQQSQHPQHDYHGGAQSHHPASAGAQASFSSSSSGAYNSRSIGYGKPSFAPHVAQSGAAPQTQEQAQYQVSARVSVPDQACTIPTTSYGMTEGSLIPSTTTRSQIGERRGRLGVSNRQTSNSPQPQSQTFQSVQLTYGQPAAQTEANMSAPQTSQSNVWSSQPAQQPYSRLQPTYQHRTQTEHDQRHEIHQAPVKQYLQEQAQQQQAHHQHSRQQSPQHQPHHSYPADSSSSQRPNASYQPPPARQPQQRVSPALPSTAVPAKSNRSADKPKTKPKPKLYLPEPPRPPAQSQLRSQSQAQPQSQPQTLQAATTHPQRSEQTPTPPQVYAHMRARSPQDWQAQAQPLRPQRYVHPSDIYNGPMPTHERPSTYTAPSNPPQDAQARAEKVQEASVEIHPEQSQQNAPPHRNDNRAVEQPSQPNPPLDPPQSQPKNQPSIPQLHDRSRGDGANAQTNGASASQSGEARQESWQQPQQSQPVHPPVILPIVDPNAPVDLATMEAHMHALVETMRFYQQKDPQAFTSVWENVRKESSSKPAITAAGEPSQPILGSEQSSQPPATPSAPDIGSEAREGTRQFAGQSSAVSNHSQQQNAPSASDGSDRIVGGSGPGKHSTTPISTQLQTAPSKSEKPPPRPCGRPRKKAQSNPASAWTSDTISSAPVPVSTTVPTTDTHRAEMPTAPARVPTHLPPPPTDSSAPSQAVSTKPMTMSSQEEQAVAEASSAFLFEVTGKLIPADVVMAFLRKSTNFVTLCEFFESQGLKFDRGSFAKCLLKAVQGSKARGVTMAATTPANPAAAPVSSQPAHGRVLGEVEDEQVLAEAESAQPSPPAARPIHPAETVNLTAVYQQPVYGLQSPAPLPPPVISQSTPVHITPAAQQKRPRGRPQKDGKPPGSVEKDSTNMTPSETPAPAHPQTPVHAPHSAPGKATIDFLFQTPVGASSHNMPPPYSAPVQQALTAYQKPASGHARHFPISTTVRPPSFGAHNPPSGHTPSSSVQNHVMSTPNPRLHDSPSFSTSNDIEMTDGNAWHPTPPRPPQAEVSSTLRNPFHSSTSRTLTPIPFKPSGLGIQAAHSNTGFLPAAKGLNLAKNSIDLTQVGSTRSTVAGNNGRLDSPYKNTPLIRPKTINIKPAEPAPELAKKIEKGKAARVSKYDPTNIARNILIIAGRHPTERPLNAHLLPLKDAWLAQIDWRTDLDTVRWDILDPAPIEVEDTAMEGDNEGDEEAVNTAGGPKKQKLSPSRLGVKRRRGTRKSWGGDGAIGSIPSGRVAVGVPSSAPNPIGMTRRELDPGLRVVANTSSEAGGTSINPIVMGSRSPSPNMTSNKRQKRSDARKGSDSAKPAPPPPPHPPFKKFRCKWTKCHAELHNFETLRRHVFKAHKKLMPYGAYPCHWLGCHKETPRPPANPIPHDFSSADDWDVHVTAHLDDVRNILGLGPAVLPSADTESAASDIDYLSDAHGNQVTPVAHLAPPGYRFVPPAGFKVNRQFKVAHDITGPVRAQGKQPSAYYKTEYDSNKKFGSGMFGNDAGNIVHTDDGVGIIFKVQRVVTADRPLGRRAVEESP